MRHSFVKNIPVKYISVLVLLNLICWTSYAQDQGAEDLDVINIENLYRDNPAPVVQPTQPAVTNQPNTVQERQELQAIQNNPEVKDSRVRSLTDLSQLSPFQDISVIQKKYLPKTDRFQFFAAGGLTTNSPWFTNLGAKLNLGYHFSESWGLELSGIFLTNSENQSAKDLRTNNNLQPDKFVTTKYNAGLNIIWSPIYGKLTNLDNKIIPFDMYFSFGGGISDTTSQEKTVPTYHIGTGQIFAITKSMAFRWDYSWNFYQATPMVDATSTAAPSKSTYNDLIFTAGVSFFFPEASYR